MEKNNYSELAFKIHCSRDFASIYKLISGSAIDSFVSVMNQSGYGIVQDSNSDQTIVDLKSIKELTFGSSEILFFIQSCFKYFLLDNDFLPRSFPGKWYRIRTFWTFLDKENEKVLTNNLLKMNLLKNRENEYRSMNNPDNLCDLSLSQKNSPRSITEKYAALFSDFFFADIQKKHFTDYNTSQKICQKKKNHLLCDAAYAWALQEITDIYETIQPYITGSIKAFWKSKGLCPHCGGLLRPMIETTGKKCYSCFSVFSDKDLLPTSMDSNDETKMPAIHLSFKDAVLNSSPPLSCYENKEEERAVNDWFLQVLKDLNKGLLDDDYKIKNESVFSASHLTNDQPKKPAAIKIKEAPVKTIDVHNPVNEKQSLSHSASPSSAETENSPASLGYLEKGLSTQQFTKYYNKDTTSLLYDETDDTTSFLDFADLIIKNSKNSEKSAQIRCVKCGRSLPVDSVFCQYCGFQVKNN